MTFMQLDFFSKAFFINLRHRPDRRAETEAELAAFGLTAERIPGYYFEDAALEQGLRMLGGKLAHYHAIRLAMDQNLDNVWVLEDDVSFVPDFVGRAGRTIADLRNVQWDLFYMGYQGPRGRDPDVRTLTDHLGECDAVYMTHCYAVNRCAFNRVMRCIIESSLGAPLDAVFVENRGRFNVKVSIPRLASQRPGYSDIDGIIYPQGR